MRSGWSTATPLERVRRLSGLQVVGAVRVAGSPAVALVLADGRRVGLPHGRPDRDVEATNRALAAAGSRAEQLTPARAARLRQQSAKLVADDEPICGCAS